MDNKIKLIILDFDGTLADTRLAHCRSYVETLSEVGYSLCEEEYRQKYFGVRSYEFMSMIGITDRQEQERIRLRKVELYPKFFDSVKLNQPLWDFCQSFRTMGCKVWIVSTGSRENIENAMAHLGIRDGVDGIIAGGEIQNCKPAPDAFLQAMKNEGVTPSQTIIFEDSKVGLEAARLSGAAYMAVKL